MPRELDNESYMAMLYFGHLGVSIHIVVRVDGAVPKGGLSKGP